MELKIGLKYTCENNGPDWYGEIINIDNGLVTVQLYRNNKIDGKGHDSIEKVLDYFETEYFKIKDDFVLPEKWCFRGKNKYCLHRKDNIKTSEWNYFNNNFKKDHIFLDRCYYHFDGDYSLYLPENYTEITFEQFERYVLKQSSTNKYTKLINILKYINEKTRTLT